MASANQVNVELTMDDLATGELKRFGKTLKRTGDRGKKDLEKIDKGAKKATRTFVKMGAAVGVVVVAFRSMQRVFRTGLGFIQASSQFEEDLAKFGVVFGKESERVGAALDDIAERTKRASSEMVGFSSGFQDILVPLGLARSDAASLSVSLTELAIDLGSFNNRLDADVIQDFKSGLVGSSETLLKYGIVANEAAVKQKAFNLGLIEQGQELTNAQKILARYAIIVGDSADAIGDAERTSGSFANTIKGIQSAVKDLSVIFGDELKASVLEAIEALGGVEGVVGIIQVAFGAVTGVMKGAIAVVKRVGLAFNGLIDILGGADLASGLFAGRFKDGLNGLVGIVGIALDAVGDVLLTALEAFGVAAFEGGKLIGRGIADGISSAFKASFEDSVLRDIVGLLPNGNLLVAEFDAAIADDASNAELVKGARFLAGLLSDMGSDPDLARQAIKTGKMVAEIVGDALSVEEVRKILIENREELESGFKANVDALLDALDIGDEGTSRVAEAFAQIAEVAADGVRRVQGAIESEVDPTDGKLSIADRIREQNNKEAFDEITGQIIGFFQSAFGGVDDAAEGAGQSAGDRYAQALADAITGLEISEAAEAALSGAGGGGGAGVAPIFGLFVDASIMAGQAVAQFGDTFGLVMDGVRDNIDKSQSFFGSFATEWSENWERMTSSSQIGKDAARDSFGVMMNSIDRLSADLVEGEADFGAFTEAILKDLAQIAIRSLILSALGGIFSGFGGGGGGAPPPALAKGGIIPGNMLGHIPINAYAGGGVANTPQVAIFGEGRGSEAFVPLPDGRNIPVKMEGGGGGDVSVSLTVNSLDPSTAATTILAQMPLIRREIAAAVSSGRDAALTRSIRGARG